MRSVLYGVRYYWFAVLVSQYTLCIRHRFVVLLCRLSVLYGARYYWFVVLVSQYILCIRHRLVVL
jgi:hypothetical protein